MINSRSIAASLLLITSANASWAAGPNNGTGPFTNLPGTNAIRDAYAAIQREAGVAEALRSGDQSLTLRQKIVGAGIETTKFQSFYKGVQVLGSTVSHHKGLRGVVEVSNDLARFDLDTRPTVSQQSAVALAKGEGGDKVLKGAPALKILPSDNADSAQLIYWVTLEGTPTEAGSNLLIDAHTGATIANSRIT